jgi:hypothetical protein
MLGHDRRRDGQADRWVAEERIPGNAELDSQLGATEVTQGQWIALMPGSPNPSGFSSCGTDCPVETVNWWEALAFANAMSVAEGLAECYALTGCNANTPGNGMECMGVTVNSSDGEVYG